MRVVKRKGASWSHLHGPILSLPPVAISLYCCKHTEQTENGLGIQVSAPLTMHPCVAILLTDKNLGRKKIRWAGQVMGFVLLMGTADMFAWNLVTGTIKTFHTGHGFDVNSREICLKAVCLFACLLAFCSHLRC
jgi:hypothetical protein